MALNDPVSDDLTLLSCVALEAAEIAMGYFGKSPQVWYKGVERSPVSEADLAVDRHIRERLLGARPDYGWLSEETVDDENRLSRGRVFIVDPIDGTRAYLAGKPDWCISLAVIADKEPLFGVLAAPVRQETWIASCGGGAHLNGRPLPLRPATGGAEPLHVSIPDMLADPVLELGASRLVRAPGGPSLALRLAKVAAGEIDGAFVRPRAREWDIAAADLMLRETGHGLIDETGVPLRYNRADPSCGTLIAGGVGELAFLRSCLPAVPGH